MRVALACVVLLGSCTAQVPLMSTRDAGSTDGVVDVVAPDLRPDRGCRETTEPLLFRVELPEVIVALDRSVSMFATRLGAGTARIQAAHQAVRAQVRAHQGGMQIGYVEFPYRCETGSCCASRLIAPALNNASAIERQMRCEGTGIACFELQAESPTGEALARARSYFDDAPMSFGMQRTVVVLTDDEPTCSSSRFGNPCDRARNEAAALFSIGGAKTHVIGIGDELRDSQCLDAVAAAGQTGRSGRPAFGWASDEVRLRRLVEEAFTAAATGGCRITFRESPPERVAVFVEGVTLPHDVTQREGWSLDQSLARPQIRLHGSVCERLREGRIQPAQISVHRSCTICGGSAARC